MTPEELKQQKESSRAFKALATPFVEQIAKELGINAAIRKETFVSHTVETEPCTVHGAKVKIVICQYGRMGGGMSENINAEVAILLPENGIVADAFMECVAKEEHIEKDHFGFYCAGPKYATYDAERRGHNIEMYSPWHDRYLRIYARNYTVSQIEQATDNLMLLAGPAVKRLADLPKLRYWKPTDAEVIAKAKEIIANADLRDEDVDHETRSHWMRDTKSFFKGWFNPWNDNGRGTFDTLWPASVGYAVSAMGIEGTFEYAVACVLLEDREFIAKARAACRIRKETIETAY